jgi:hypothetical protein
MNHLLALLVLALSCTSHLVNGADSIGHFYKKELRLIGENDAFRFNNKDGYYTNGFFFRYSTAEKKNPTSVVEFIELGQLMYNANFRRIYDQSQIDRPICGFLFLKYGKTKFWKSNTYLEWNASIGTIGKASFAKNVQEFFHTIGKINNEVSGWKWQVKDEVGINGGVKIGKSIGIVNKRISFFIEPTLQLNAGNTFTNAQFAPLFKLGIFNTGKQNSWWGGHLLSTNTHRKQQPEIYLFTQPSIGYHWYNATVQGGLFRKDKGEVLASIYPWLFRQNTGIVYNKPRWSASFAVCYMGKEATTQIMEHRYRALQFAWRFN